MTAQEAFNDWKRAMKVDMQVRSDEQWFTLGYEIRQPEIDSLLQLITDLDNEIKKLKRPGKQSKTLQKSSVKN